MSIKFWISFLTINFDVKFLVLFHLKKIFLLVFLVQQIQSFLKKCSKNFNMWIECEIFISNMKLNKLINSINVNTVKKLLIFKNSKYFHVAEFCKFWMFFTYPHSLDSNSVWFLFLSHFLYFFLRFCIFFSAHSN